MSLTDRADAAADATAALGLRWQRVEDYIGRLPAGVSVERGPVFRHQERFTPEQSFTWVAERTLVIRGANVDDAEEVFAAMSPLDDQIGDVDVDGPHWQLVDDKAVREQVGRRRSRTRSASQPLRRRPGRHARCAGRAC
jgi:hypothetical protein